MKIIPLPTELRVAVGFSHKAIVRAADLVALGAVTTGKLQLFPDVAVCSSSYTLPAGSCIARVGFQLVTAFAGGAVSALTMALGDGAVSNRYLDSAHTDLFTASANSLNAAVAQWPYTYTQADTATGTTNALVASFFSTGGNLSALTDGQVEIYFDLQLLSRLTTVTEP